MADPPDTVAGAVADEALLAAWRRGDADARDALISRHFSSVYDFFRGKVGHEARDLAQRTFVGCVESLERVEQVANFRAYLFGIARNQLLAYLRRRERANRVFDPAQRSLAEICSDDTSPSGALARTQQERRLLAALRRIPIDFQIATELYYWEEMGIAQIAAVLGIPKGTVMSRLGRARRQLERELEASSEDSAELETTLDSLGQWARATRAAAGES